MTTTLFPHSTSPSRPLPSNPQTASDIRGVLENGYIILPNQFSPHEAHAAKLEIQLLAGASPENGRNPFEGLKTNRIYSLLNKTREFDRYVTLPRVLALNDYFLEPGYCVSAFHTIQINSGSEAQPLHHDDGFAQLPRPRPPLGSAIIVAFDEFTVDNGATRVVPRSHLLSSTEPPDAAEAVPAVCPAGTVVYFISTTWHGGGANRTDKARQSLTVQYCQPYMRQIENQYLSVDPRKLDAIPPRIVELMGYKTFSGFIGYVDGLSPREAARRMATWSQKPVDYRPPPFAHHKDSKL